MFSFSIINTKDNNYIIRVRLKKLNIKIILLIFVSIKNIKDKHLLNSNMTHKKINNYMMILKKIFFFF